MRLLALPPPRPQESIVSDLHLAEAVAALLILAEGGSLVIKMFTFFESETVCLLYLLYLSFGKMDVFKPATSKEGNSEVTSLGSLAGIQSCSNAIFRYLKFVSLPYLL